MFCVLPISYIYELKVYTDSTKVNPSSSRVEDPISVYVLNASDEEKIPILVGFNPGVSSNKIKLNGLLKLRNITDKTMISTVRYNTKVETKRQFLFSVMEPLMMHQKTTGISYQVGRGIDSKVYRFFPFVVSFNADQIDQDLKAGSSHKKAHMQCNLCTLENCLCFYKKPFPRLENNGLLPAIRGLRTLPRLQNIPNIPMGYKVKFSCGHRKSTGFVCPHTVYKIQFKAMDQDFDWVDPTIAEIDNEMMFKNPEDDKWYLIAEHRTSNKDIIRGKCFLKMSEDDTVEYIIIKLEWKVGILDDNIDNNRSQKAVYSIDNVMIDEVISSPKIGFSNIRGTGVWEEAVVIGLNSSGSFRVIYTSDGEIELNVPDKFFIPTGGVLRDDAKFEMVAKGLAAAEQEKLDYCVRHNGTKRLRIGKSGSSLEANNINLANLVNVKGGENPLKKWYDIPELPFLTFYGALSVDYMHSFKEGMLTNILSFVLEIVRMHSIYEPSRFSTNLLKISDRLNYFPSFGASSLCRMVRFCNGLDDIIEKNDENPLECNKPNIFLGNFEAWKRPALLVQLLFIVASNDIVSDDEDWIERVYNNKNKHENFENVPVFSTKKINLRRLCVQSLVAAMEVHLFYQCPSLTDVDLNSFEQVLRNCR